MTMTLERHPEEGADERCIGNFLPDELPQLEQRYGALRVGEVPYDHDGAPKRDYGSLRPVFVNRFKPPPVETRVATIRQRPWWSRK